ncbi:MAG: hypothetical protein ACD_8C00036G0005 [uncultured bacterium]|nr:MAG: hypothetical protein ACD_8C00036G0005 [uncultured bacterium]
MTKKKFSFAIIIFVAGIALAVFISSNAIREAYRSQSIEEEVEKLKQEAQRVQNENKELSERIAYFQTADFQEKVAKEKLNLQKPDENVVVVKSAVKKEEAGSTQQVSVETVVDPTPNYRKWWNIFFKY